MAEALASGPRELPAASGALRRRVRLLRRRRPLADRARPRRQALLRAPAGRDGGRAARACIPRFRVDLDSIVLRRIGRRQLARLPALGRRLARAARSSPGRGGGSHGCAGCRARSATSATGTSRAGATAGSAGSRRAACPAPQSAGASGPSWAAPLRSCQIFAATGRSAAAVASCMVEPSAMISLPRRAPSRGVRTTATQAVRPVAGVTAVVELAADLRQPAHRLLLRHGLRLPTAPRSEPCRGVAGPPDGVTRAGARGAGAAPCASRAQGHCASRGISPASALLSIRWGGMRARPDAKRDDRDRRPALGHLARDADARGRRPSHRERRRAPRRRGQPARLLRARGGPEPRARRLLASRRSPAAP